MTSRQWFGVFAAIVAAFILGDCSGSRNTDAAVERARNAEAQVDELLVERDELTTVADSIDEAAHARARQYTADSLGWQIERAGLRRQAGAAAADFDRTAALLRAVGDSTVSAMVDSLEVAHDREVRAYRETIESLVSDRAAVLFQRQMLGNMVDVLREQDTISRRVIAAQQIQIDAWESVANPPWWKRATSKLPDYAIGALAGVALWETVR